MIDVYIYMAILFLSTALILFSLDRGQPFFEAHKWVAISMVVTLCVEITGFLMGLKKINNLFLFNTFGYAQTLFLSFIYTRELSRNKKILIQGFIFTFSICVVLNNIFLQNFIHVVSSNTLIFGSSALVLQAIMYFHSIFSDENFLDKDILRLPFFWMSTGILFYFSGIFALMGYANFLIDNDYALAASLYRITTILASLMYSLFALGFSWHKLSRK